MKRVKLSKINILLMINRNFVASSVIFITVTTLIFTVIVGSYLPLITGFIALFVFFVFDVISYTLFIDGSPDGTYFEDGNLIEARPVYRYFKDRILSLGRTKRSFKKPSKFSLFFAAALQKPEDREFIIDNIEERFAKDVKKHGYRWAKYMLWRDNLVGFWSALGAKIIKGLKWAGLGYLVEKLLLK